MVICVGHGIVTTPYQIKQLLQGIAPYELLRKALSEETVIHLDETPLRVVKSERSKCYFWAASSAQEFNQHNIAYFFYAASRGGEVISQIIGPDYRGCLMCDGYSAYQQERLPNGTLGACLIHIARKFKEIVKIGKGAKILQHSKAAEAAIKLGEILSHRAWLKLYHRRRKSSATALTS